MKNVFLSLSSAFIVAFNSLAQITPIIQPSPRKVQVAILFDTSNSMDGLIDQAKTRIWSIINELSALRYQGQMPTIEIALYDYGNSSLTLDNNYIRLQTGLTTDLDLISEKLFGLTTNGGDEYCGAVIQKSMQELGWSTNPLDLKMIYIAGNEPFNQGTIAYNEVCKTAGSRSIFVNTIYCGNYDQGIREFWKDCATIAGGDYFNIDANKQVVHIDTPYDIQINSYNDSLNKTYYGYGSLGVSKKSNQLMQDMNAQSEAISVKTERAIVKSKASYMNSSWDLIDAVDEGKVGVASIPEAQLPAEFQGKTEEEKNALLDAKRKEREAYQNKINELAVERQKYIDEEMKKLPEGQDDFGSAVNASLLKKATEIGYEKEKK
jgi:hypothetical protein